jgi:hypothetical protein
MVQAMTYSAAFWLTVGLAALAAYLLPTWVALGRRVDGVLLVFLVNLIGWPAAILLACSLPGAAAIRGLEPGQVRGSVPGKWSGDAGGSAGRG